MGYSTIQFKDHTEALMPVRVEATTMTQARLETLATALVAHSNAVVMGVSVFFAKATPGTPVDATHDLVKDKALITFRSSVGHIVKVSIPAPKASIFDRVIKGVRYVSTTVGESVATDMSTASGKTLTFLTGRFVNKPGKGQ